MKAGEYLDAAKARLKIGSDYQLAKAMGISQGNLTEIRTGKRPLSAYAVFWLAVTLEADPAAMLAELELSREKNPKRLAFWNSFLSRAATLAAVACTLALLAFGQTGSAPAGTGGGFKRRLNFA